MNVRRAMLAVGGFSLLAVSLLAVGLRPGEHAATAEAAGVLPAGWPASLQIGSADSPGGAAAMKSVAPYGFRYQYLAGGVNTGSGWATWNANGQFATYYIQESVAASIVPVFTYYQIRQSAPGNGMGETDGVVANLQNTATMTSFYNDLKLFYERAGAFPNNKVVLHVEPDMWGYIQQRGGDNAANFGVKVGSTGMPELAGLPDNASGLAKAVVKLRDTYAPNVVLGYHLSIWGTGVDIQWSQTPDSQTDALATRAGAFYNSLGANFDISFAEFSDRDAGFKQAIYGDGGASWFDADDFARHARFLGMFSTVTQKRIVLWQIPLGNTKMRAENNTWNHYQDNRVEWLLDDPGRTHLQTYINSGVVAFLFGRGADGPTCACDANGDGVTNPAAINGNNLTSLNADDDGGFFKQKVAAYYAAGAMGLNGTSPAATPTTTGTATNTPVATSTATNTPVPPTATPTRTTLPPTATPTRTATPTQAPAASWTASGSASKTSVRRGASITLRASARSTQTKSALVDVEVYNSAGQKVFQQYWDNQAFNANVTRTFSTAWTIPSTLPTGTYTLKVGVFAPGWAGMFAWNNSAATFTVKR
ncbi:MAG: hypothetical protein ABI577_08560 [bacterium]